MSAVLAPALIHPPQSIYAALSLLAHEQPYSTEEPDRNSYIGGSSAAVILGVSKFMSPVKLWSIMTGRTQRETEADMKHARRRRLLAGKRWEATVFEMLYESLRYDGHEVELVCGNRRYTDREHPFLRAEIDFEIVLDGVPTNVEIKTVDVRMAKYWGEIGTDQIPDYYGAQCFHGLGVRPTRRCVVGALFGVDNLGAYVVERDDAIIAGIRAKEAQFWNVNILQDIPPDPLDFADVTTIFPKDTGTSIEANGAIADAVSDLREVKQQIKDLEKDESRLKMRVGKFIGDNTSLVYDGKSIATWTAQNSRRLDTDRLKMEAPDIYQRFSKTGASRVLRLAQER